MPEEGRDICQWFFKCSNTATVTIKHPTLGDVPACDKCTKFAKDTPGTGGVPPIVARKLRELNKKLQRREEER